LVGTSAAGPVPPAPATGQRQVPIDACRDYSGPAFRQVRMPALPPKRFGACDLAGVVPQDSGAMRSTWNVRRAACRGPSAGRHSSALRSLCPRCTLRCKAMPGGRPPRPCETRATHEPDGSTGRRQLSVGARAGADGSGSPGCSHGLRVGIAVPRGTLFTPAVTVARRTQGRGVILPGATRVDSGSRRWED
jgi:hypothetical protein